MSLLENFLELFGNLGQISGLRFDEKDFKLDLIWNPALLTGSPQVIPGFLQFPFPSHRPCHDKQDLAVGRPNLETALQMLLASCQIVIENGFLGLPPVIFGANLRIHNPIQHASDDHQAQSDNRKGQHGRRVLPKNRFGLPRSV